MDVAVLVIVVLATLVTIASGIWVAIGLMAALRYPDKGNGESSSDITHARRLT